MSTFKALELAVLPGHKAQVIDLDLLESPPQGIADQPGLEGGVDGHVSITPVHPDGSIDHVLLVEWVATRGTEANHRLTEIIKNALVDTVKRSR